MAELHNNRRGSLQRGETFDQCLGPAAKLDRTSLTAPITGPRAARRSSGRAWQGAVEEGNRNMRDRAARAELSVARPPPPLLPSAPIEPTQSVSQPANERGAGRDGRRRTKQRSVINRTITHTRAFIINDNDSIHSATLLSPPSLDQRLLLHSLFPFSSLARSDRDSISEVRSPLLPFLPLEGGASRAWPLTQCTGTGLLARGPHVRGDGLGPDLLMNPRQRTLPVSSQRTPA